MVGNVSEVVTHVHQVRKDGMGVIGMKLCGEVSSIARPAAAMRFAFKNAGAQAVTSASKRSGDR